MKHHVAINAGHLIGKAETEAEALAICRLEGFDPTGLVDFIPEDLAPDLLCFDPDGRGAFIVTCDL